MTTEDAEKALDYLKETDEPDAKFKARIEYLKEKKKTVIAWEQSESNEKSQAAKEQEAYNSAGYRGWMEEYQSALIDFHIMHNRRLTASLQIEVWRSINANTRQGNI